MRNTLWFLLLVTIFFTGCSIEKRHYNKGFHVQWKKQTSIDYSSTHEEEQANSFDYQTVSTPLDLESSSEFPTYNEEHSIIKNQQSNNYSVNKVTPVSVYSNRSVSRKNQSLASTSINSSDKSRRTSNSRSSSFLYNGDLFLFGSFLCLGLVTFIGLLASRKNANRLSKWASKNRIKTQLTVAGIQTSLGAVALYQGYNFGKMGYELSSTPYLVGAGVMAALLGLIPMFKKKGEIVLQKRLTTRRTSFIGLAMSAMMVLGVIGNRAAHNEEAFLHNGLDSIDQVIHGQNETPEGTTMTHEAPRMLTSEIVLGGSAVALVFLGILACAGVAGVVFGVAFLIEGSITAALLAPAGIGLLALAIAGMKSVVAKLVRENCNTADS